MFILGKTSDDKGTQLEELVSAILAKLGYQGVTTNKIGSGGEELDVTAEYPVPLLGGETKKRLLAECKAYKKPVDLPTWLKFLGKILTDEVKTGHKVSGCLIALSGINGNCQGAYEDFRSKRDDVTVIAGETLHNLLETIFGIEKAGKIEQVVKGLSSRTIRLLDLAYYQKAIYWIVGFQGETYSLLGSEGKPLEKPLATKLAKMIKKSEALGTYVDLQEEAEAIKTAFNARKYLITQALIGDGRASLEKDATEAGFSKEVIEQAASRLAELGIVTISKGDMMIRPVEDAGYKHIGRMFVELLDKYTLLEGLGKPCYDKHINGHLLDEILSIQGNLQLTEEQRAKAIELLKLSPSGLLACLKPLEVIVNHRKEKPLDERIAKADVDYFFQVLHQHLRSDFTQSALSEYFHETRKRIELDTVFRVRLKSDKAVEFEDEVRERNRLGELDLSLTKGKRKFVLMLALNDGPEPWEQLEWVKKQQMKDEKETT